MLGDDETVLLTEAGQIRFWAELAPEERGGVEVVLAERAG